MRIALAVLVLSFGAVPQFICSASAGNLLVNGAFESTSTPWGNACNAWSTFDAHQSSKSGSLRTSSCPGFAVANQAVSINGGQMYALFGKVFITSGGITANLRIDFYSGSTWIGVGASVDVSSAGTWVAVGQNTTTPPPSATSAIITLTRSDTPGDVYFDDLFVGIPSAPTISFSASPQTISPGGSTTLSWSTEDAVRVDISGLGPQNLSGAVTVSPPATTSYTLSAVPFASGAPPTTRNLTVTVSAPPVVSFASAPATIFSGATSTLAWSVQDATAVTINNGIGDVAPTGTQRVRPSSSTTWTLTATGSGGTRTGAASVSVTPPPVGSTLVTVESDRYVTTTGIRVAAGDVLTIVATGSSDLSKLNGGYTTDPDGVVIVAPPSGSGAYNFFATQNPPGAPLVGTFKNTVPGDGSQLGGGRYGALVGGVSPSPFAAGPSDFPYGFVFIGSNNSITIANSGYFYLASNDVNNDFDNAGSFAAAVIRQSPTPTIGTIVPASGSVRGGTRVAITGTNFDSAVAVTFGEAAATIVSVQSTSIEVLTPAHAAGVMDVTVTNPSGANTTKAAAFTYIDDRVFAQLAITAFPTGMLQTANSGGATDSFVISNFGGLVSDITLTSFADFFTQSPTTFRLAAGESKVIALTGRPKPAGSYEGTSVINATNFPTQISVPVRLLSAEPPAAQPRVRVSRLQVDVVDIPGVNEPGKVELTNSGDGVARGILVADADWLIPQSGVITIEPSQTVSVGFTIDDAKRPEFDINANTITSTLSFIYLTGAAGKIAPLNGGSTGQTQTQVSSTQLPNATVAPVPPFSLGEIGFMIPGIGRPPGFVTRFSMLNASRGASIDHFRLFYQGAGSSPASARSVSVASLPFNVSYSVGNVLGLFGESSGVGTLQIRGNNLSGLIPSAGVTKIDDPRGTVGYAIPVARSDRAVKVGTTLVLSGIEKKAGFQSDVYLQEMSGNAGAVRIDFADAAGSVLRTRTESLGAFGFMAIVDAAPEGSVSAFIAPEATSAASVYSVAVVRDARSFDARAVADWGRLYGGTGEAIVPLVTSTSASRTELTITNRDATPASGELRYYGALGESRRRPVRRGGSGKGETALAAPATRVVNLAPRATITIEDVVRYFGGAPDRVAYIVFTPSNGNLALNATQVIPDSVSGGRIGASIPAIPRSAGLKLGERKRFASIEDGGATADAQRIGGTFRNALGIVEASGSEVTVRATLRYAHSFAGPVFARGESPKEYRLDPGAQLFVADLARDLIGALRDSLKDLHGVEVEIEVIGGTGTIVPFVLTTDNGTGDLVFRLE